MEEIKNGHFTMEHGLNIMKWSIWSDDNSARWEPNDDGASLDIGSVDLRGEVGRLVNASNK